MGTPYSNAYIDFTINDGSTDFAVSDSFTIATTVGAMPSAQRWVDKRFTDSGGDMEWLFMAPGLAGTDEIYGGIRTYENVSSDYYNWGIIGTTGYIGANSYSTQPGISGEKHVPMWNSSIPFWLVVNGRRMVLVAKISTVYQTTYLGHFLPYGTPNQYPYPLAVGGMGYTANARWSDTSDDKNRTPLNPGSDGSVNNGNLEIYAVDGTWIKMGNYYSNGTPVGNSNNVLPLHWTFVRDNCDGASYALVPLTMVQANPENALGELDGCYWVSGFSNSSENIITISAQDYLVVQDCHRNGVNDYRAIQLA